MRHGVWGISYRSTLAVSLIAHISLGHMYNNGWLCLNCFNFITMSSEFTKLMEEIRKSRDEALQLREELEQKLTDFQSEVTSAQEKASRDISLDKEHKNVQDDNKLLA